MKRVLYRMLLISALGIPTYLYSSDMTGETGNKDEFKAIAQQIENNSRDSYGQTKEGFEKGLFKLEQLYRHGDDSLKVQMLLAESYRIYGLKYLGNNPTEQTKYYAKSKEIYESLINDYPENVDVLLDYVGLIRDAEASISIYKKIITIDPKNVRAHKVMSTYYKEKGETEKALEEKRKAFMYAVDGNDIYYLGTALAEWLERLGRHEEAEEIWLEKDRRVIEFNKKIMEKEKRNQQ